MKIGTLIYYSIPALCGLAMLVLGIVMVINPKVCTKKSYREDADKVTRTRRGGIAVIICGVIVSIFFLVLSNPFERARKEAEAKQLTQKLQETKKKTATDTDAQYNINDLLNTSDENEDITYTPGFVTENNEYINKDVGFIFTYPEGCVLNDSITGGTEFHAALPDNNQFVLIVHNTGGPLTITDKQQFCDLLKLEIESNDTVSDVQCTWNDDTMQSFPHNSQWELVYAVNVNMKLQGVQLYETVLQLNDGNTTVVVTTAGDTEESLASLMERFTAYTE